MSKISSDHFFICRLLGLRFGQLMGLHRSAPDRSKYFFHEQILCKRLPPYIAVRLSAIFARVLGVIGLWHAYSVNWLNPWIQVTGTRSRIVISPYPDPSMVKTQPQYHKLINYQSLSCDSCSKYFFWAADQVAGKR